jgi:hypothetical protein
VALPGHTLEPWSQRAQFRKMAIRQTCLACMLEAGALEQQPAKRSLIVKHGVVTPCMQS